MKDAQGRSKFKTLFKTGVLLCYILCTVVLVAESMMPGKVSSDHSNTVGGIIDDTVSVNKTIEPQSLAFFDENGGELPATVYVGDTLCPLVTFHPADATFQAYTLIGDDKVSIGANGAITFLKAGEARVTAVSTRNRDLTATAVFNVEAVALQNIEISNLPSPCYVGDKVNLSYLAVPFNATVEEVTFASEAANIALSPKGELRFLAIGKAAFTVSAGYFSKTFEISVLPRPVTSVTLLNENGAAVQNVSRYIGDCLSFSTAVLPVNATYKTLEFSLSGDDIASLEAGDTFVKVSLLGVGSCLLTAASPDGPAAMVNIEAAPVPLLELKLKADGEEIDEAVMYEGDKLELSCLIFPASPTDLELSWSVKGDAVSLDAAGANAVITARKTGAAVVTVAGTGNNAGITAALTVEVKAVTVSLFALSPASEIMLGKTLRLAYTVETQPVGRDLKDTPVFTSSNPQVIGVDGSGVVSGKAKGSAVITARLGNLADSIEICCRIENELQRLEFPVKQKTLIPGEDYQPDITLYPLRPAYAEIILTSSSPAVAAVQGNRITALQKGETFITASSPYYPGITATMKLLVEPNIKGFKIDCSALTLYEYETANLSVVTDPGGIAVVNGLRFVVDGAAASCNGGRLTALKAGVAKVYAVYEGSLYQPATAVTAAVTVTVKSRQDSEFVPAAYILLSDSAGNPVGGKLTLNRGNNVFLTVSILPEKATIKTFTATAEGKNTVVTLKRNGIAVFAAEAGTAVVTVTSGDDAGLFIKLTVEVVYTPPTALSVLSSGGAELYIGENSTISAVNGEGEPVSALWRYEKVDGAEISAHEDGTLTVTGKAECAVVLQALYSLDNDLKAQITLHIRRRAADFIRVESETIKLCVGENAALNAAAGCLNGAEPSDANLIFRIFSGDCIVVAGDTVTALKKGDAVIRAASAADPAVFTDITVNVANVDAVKIELSGIPARVSDGDVFKATAAVFPQNSTFKAVLYSVSDQKVAAVTSDGTVAALAPGVFTLKVTSLYNDNGPQAEKKIVITVLAVPVTSLRLTGPQELYVGDSAKIAAALNENGRRPSSQRLVWSSSDPAIAAVDSSGIVTALKKGEITVTAAVGGEACLEKTINIRINNVAAQTLSMRLKENGELFVGTAARLIVDCLPKNTTVKEIRFGVSNEGIIKVDGGGGIKAIKAGDVVVTAYWKENEEICVSLPLKVKNVLGIDRILLKGIDDFAGGRGSMTRNAAARITPYYRPGVTYRTVAYASSDEKIAKIDNNGIVTALSTGETLITMTYYDGDDDTVPYVFTIKLTVTKQKLSSIFDNFAYLVRKSIGHFGAFLVLGIFCALSYLFFIKSRFAGGALTLLSGFGIAAFTELVQYFTPGRGPSFNDVMLDFCGFCFSALLIIFIAAAVAVIKFAVKMSRKKREAGFNDDKR